MGFPLVCWFVVAVIHRVKWAHGGDHSRGRANQQTKGSPHPIKPPLPFRPNHQHMSLQCSIGLLIVGLRMIVLIVVAPIARWGGPEGILHASWPFPKPVGDFCRPTVIHTLTPLFLWAVLVLFVSRVYASMLLLIMHSSTLHRFKCYLYEVPKVVSL